MYNIYRLIMKANVSYILYIFFKDLSDSRTEQCEAQFECVK